MAVSVFPSSSASASASGEVTTYYGITASGNHTVDLPAGIYDLTSSKEVTVGGLDVNGTASLQLFSSGIDSLFLKNLYDLDDWASRTSGFGSSEIYAITYGDGLYVAGGSSGKLTTSPDGITWTTRTSGFGTTVIRGVTYGDGLYVAVGDSGTLTTSTDGTTWTSRTSGFGTTIIRGVTYGDGLYLAVGYSGKLTTSEFEALYLSLELKTPVTTLS